MVGLLDWHNSHAALCRLDSWYFTCIQHDPKSRNPLERQFSCRTTQNTNVLTLKGYPGILDGRLCCLADLEKSEAQARVLHAPNECWLFNTASYQSRMWSAGLSDKCARFHQCLCSQSDQQDMEEHKSTGFLCGNPVQWKKLACYLQFCVTG